MTSIFENNLHRQAAAQRVCKAFGIRLTPSPMVVQLAKSAGFDALFIELEHSTLSLENASQLSVTGLLAGVTPFVRVPYQCGDGVVQRVLDGGAMGVIFPHIHGKEDATAAVQISKYPPMGRRSMTGQLPQFSCIPQPASEIVKQANATGSTVIVMIETKESIDNVDEIAKVEGVDVLLIGSNDLSIELGIPADFDHPKFRSALEKVSRACKDNSKIFGLAGIYDNPAIQTWAVRALGAGFLLGQQDSGFIAKGAKQCVEALEKIETPN